MRQHGQRVNGGAIYQQLEVQVVAGGTARAAHIADHIPLRDPLPHLHGGLALQVSIAGGIVGRVNAVIVGSSVRTVVDGYKVTVVIIQPAWVITPLCAAWTGVPPAAAKSTPRWGGVSESSVRKGAEIAV